MVEVDPAEGRTPRGDTTQVDRQHLAARGYTTTPLLGDDDLDRLRAVLATLGDLDGIGFFASHAALAPPARRRVSDAVWAVLAPAVARRWSDAVPIAAALLSKAARTGSPLPYHQDLTYTDEREVRSFVVWAPLVDLTGEHGVLRVVPGSHLWASGPRPGGPAAMATEPLQAELEVRSVPVPVRAGEAVVWDSALVHGSRGNGADVSRPVATMALLGSPSPLRYYHRGRDGEVTGFSIDLDFFFSPKPFIDAPQGYVGVEPWAPAVTTADLAAHLVGR